MSGSRERLGRYELLFKIASGGMGSVHLAQLTGRGDFVRLFAIKRMHAHFREFSDFTTELLYEAAIAGRIRHPNVVPVLDSADEGSETFLVMEYVEGASLAELMQAAANQRRRLPVPVVLRIADDMLAGLHAAHVLEDAGKPLSIVHRDVSPQNVLVGVDGISRVTDFGIAKAASKPAITKTGITKGKIAYMAPEQARGLPLDARADLWAAGVVIWEMLAGERLYKDTEDLPIAHAVAAGEPRRLREVRPDLSSELDEAVHAALQREPVDRVRTAADLRDRLRSASSDDLADNATVAAVVNRYAGKTIAERRARIEAAQKETPEIQTSTEVMPKTPAAPLASIPPPAPAPSPQGLPIWTAVVGGAIFLAGAVAAVVHFRSPTVSTDARAEAPAASPAAMPSVDPGELGDPLDAAIAEQDSDAGKSAKRPARRLPPPKASGGRLMPNPYKDHP